MTYAIISLGGKLHRVQEGERLLVDRLSHGEGKTFHPDVVMLGGDGNADLAPKGVEVTARVVGHVLGEKIRIGKYRPKSGYRRHTGFRSRLSQVEIESIGKKSATRKAAAERPVRDSGPGEGVRRNREVPPADKQAVEPKPLKGLPKGYEELTVAEISEGAKQWQRPELEAALTYEQEHGKRKGAISALESALAAKEEDQ